MSERHTQNERATEVWEESAAFYWEGGTRRGQRENCGAEEEKKIRQVRGVGGVSKENM